MLTFLTEFLLLLYIDLFQDILTHSLLVALIFFHVIHTNLP